VCATVSNSSTSSHRTQEPQWIDVISDAEIERLPIFRLEDKGRGYVYLLRARNGLTKIGATVNLPARIAKHRRKWQGELDFEVIGVLLSENCYQLESSLHLRFRAWRSKNKRRSYRGDWFDLPPEDVAYIKSIGGAA